MRYFLPPALHYYTVHVNPADPQGYEKPVFVREGFSLWAFILAVLWALYHRLWLAAGVLLLTNIALISATRADILSQGQSLIIDIGVKLIFAFLAQDLWRNSLKQRGYITADIVAAESYPRAAQRFYERHWQKAQPVRGHSPWNERGVTAV